MNLLHGVEVLAEYADCNAPVGTRRRSDIGSASRASRSVSCMRARRRSIVNGAEPS
jgi:hypothetical protein